ncbi:MAG TPA: hypothetical protein VNH15_03685 [Elusimicrobiota bacterium]|nr:hypothetical protein [Elusimicrobiota bacterium]
MNYDDRIVCFLDVLGFREHIHKTIGVSGNDNVDRISEIVEAIQEAGQILEIDQQKIFSPKRITQFSDSIVISFPADKESGVYHAIEEILWVQMSFLKRDMLCRGAIARGKLMHGSDVLFGPAMVDAYMLESKAANYPRVILDQAIIDAGAAAHSMHHGSEDEREGIMRFLSKDGDGMYYIDYISKARSECDSPEEHPAYLLKLRKIIVHGVQNQDPSVRVKYLWLKEKFASCLELIKRNVSAAPGDELNATYLAIPEL